MLYPPLPLGIPTISEDFPTIPKGTLRVIYRRLKSCESVLLLERKGSRRGCHCSATSSFFRCRRSVHAVRSIEFSCSVACLRIAQLSPGWGVDIKDPRASQGQVHWFGDFTALAHQENNEWSSWGEGSSHLVIWSWTR